jgi:hypothetical protein
MPPKIKRRFYEPGPHNHSTYKNHLCDCDVCRAAYNTYVEQRRKTRAAMIAADPTLATHGKRSTYINWGCRCPECRAANSAYRHVYYTNKEREP